jgi:hypothetical protein
MAARSELTMPGENVLAHTAHLYQPGTRRPYGVLEWPACCGSSPRTRRLPAIRHTGSRRGGGLKAARWKANISARAMDVYK